jgi:hypothetical protein
MVQLDHNIDVTNLIGRSKTASRQSDKAGLQVDGGDAEPNEDL